VAPVPPPPPPQAPPAIATDIIPANVTDTPAPATDNLFVPQLYGPTYTAAGRLAQFAGLVLSGGDRLERHRWALSGYYQLVPGGFGGGSFAYSNRQLAPLTLSLAAAQFSFADVPPVLNTNAPTAADFVLERRERDLTFDALRFFYGNPVQAGFAFIESYRPDDPAVLVPLRRIAGPHLSAAYVGAAAAPYPGVTRLFAASIDAAAYPRAWSSAGYGFFDLRGELAAVVPLPLTRRHTLTLTGRARSLAGAPAADRLLRVGGYTLQPLARQSEQPERFAAGSNPFLPPGALFAEPLRGFEDYPFYADRIAIGSARYRVPIIIDHGWASTLWVLPALFIQQVNLELFAVAATDGRTGGQHSAAGGSVSLNFAFWIIPMAVQYQLTRRFTDDQALVHLVQLGL
jgi:hypothetical protein